MIWNHICRLNVYLTSYFYYIIPHIMLKDVITDPLVYTYGVIRKFSGIKNFVSGCILKLSAHDSTEYRKDKQKQKKTTTTTTTTTTITTTTTKPNKRLYYALTGGNWQIWKRVFLTCPCHKIYRDEAVGLKRCKNTWKITIFVKMWNLGQYRENLIFCQ